MDIVYDNEFVSICDNDIDIVVESHTPRSN